MSDGNAFSMGFASAYRMAMDAEEKKKEQQAYKSYFDMQAQDAQAKIQPITDAATRANENSFSADVKRDASQMTTDIAANNPYLTQRVGGIPTAPTRQATKSELDFFNSNPNVGGYASPDNKVVLNPSSSLSPNEKQSVAYNESVRLAIRQNPQIAKDFPITPEQQNAFSSYSENPEDIKHTIIARISSGDPSAMATPEQISFVKNVGLLTSPVTPAQQSAWQANNNNNAQQADNQAAQTQQMLQQAQQRYGTEMFGKLGALVEKGMDPRMAMKIADNHIAKAEAAALKEQMSMNVKILSDKNANPEQKQAVLAQMMVDNPQAARGLAEAFGLKQQDPKLSIAPDGRVVDMRTGQPVNGAPVYNKPEKPAGQLTEYQRWQIEKDKANPAEKTQNIPGFGNITNAQIMSLYNSAQPTTSEHEAFNPLTGQKEKMQTTNPGKPETIALLKPYVDRIKGITQQQTAPSGNSLGDPLLDAALAEIRQNGAEAAQGKLAAKFGAEKAKEIMGQVSLFLQEK